MTVDLIGNHPINQYGLETQYNYKHSVECMASQLYNHVFSEPSAWDFNTLISSFIDCSDYDYRGQMRGLSISMKIFRRDVIRHVRNRLAKY